VKIGVVSPYAWTVPGGVNDHIMNLVEQLERHGHQAWVIAPAGGFAPSKMALPSSFICAGRALPVRANGSVAYVNPWPLMLQKMGRILANGKFDVVHVHEPTIPSTAAAATMAARVPVVGTFHAAGYASHYYERYNPLATRIMTCVGVRIAVSEAARDCVVGHFPGHYRVVPNGIDVKKYAAVRDGTKVRGRILFIGRPEPRKGLSVLVDAFARLRSSFPEASLVLAGPTADELQALMSRSRNTRADTFEGIEALGRVSNEVKLEQMGKAEVICAPSLGGESFGIVLIEALAAGVPVVASDIPGYRAVLDGGDAGVLVPPGDASALENGLLSVLLDRGMQRDLSLQGVALAERYSWGRLIDQVLEAYEEAMGLGLRRVREPRVPLLTQIRYSLRLTATADAASREAAERAPS
jgi:phosphatidyl-myo-inositol alpha-mannosyltransferase